MRLLPIFLAATSFLFAQEVSEEPPGEPPMFGVSVVLSAGLTGQVYKLNPDSGKLPNFKKLTPVGTIYTYSLNIPPRDFTRGIPGVPDLIEWFALDYSGRFWIAEPGEYRFHLTSDDGSQLFIDDKRVIDNNGIHPVLTEEGKVKLKAGAHSIRVSYFQGPRYHVALILEVTLPNGARRVFSTQDFRPPADVDVTLLAEPSKK
jgi:hypothetical protein